MKLKIDTYCPAGGSSAGPDAAAAAGGGADAAGALPADTEAPDGTLTDFQSSSGSTVRAMRSPTLAFFPSETFKRVCG